MDKIDKLTDDSLFMSDLETIEMHEKEQKAIRAYGEKLVTEKGLAQEMDHGKAQGKLEEQRELILLMMKNNIDMDLISKITKNSINEIKEIIK